MHFRPHLGVLFASTLLAFTASAQEMEEDMEEDNEILVEAPRMSACDAGSWCDQGSFGGLPLGGPIYQIPTPNIFAGGGGSGHIVVERDREEEEEEECEEQSSNASFLASGGRPNNRVVVHGEVHDNPYRITGDTDQRANETRQQDLVDRYLADGINLCIGMELGRGREPATSQESMYRYADANNIPVFNVDLSQAVGRQPTPVDNGTLNSRDVGMAITISMALAMGVNGRPCDHILVFVGDAHSSQTVSSDVSDGGPFQRVTLADVLRMWNIDVFVDNRAMHEEYCD